METKKLYNSIDDIKSDGYVELKKDDISDKYPLFRQGILFVVFKKEFDSKNYYYREIHRYKSKEDASMLDYLASKGVKP